MPGPYVPQGELESLGIGAETTFGVKATPTIWHAFTMFQPKTTTDAVARAPRLSLASPYPGTGGRTVGMTLDVEPDSDTFPQLLAYTMGAQTNPSTALYSSTLSGAITAGNTSCVVASALFVYVGETIVIGGTTPETVVVTSVQGTTLQFTPALSFNHANNQTVTATGGGGGAGGKLNIMSPGSPLPSFTLQLNRPTTGVVPTPSICTDYLGTCVDQLALSFAAKQGLRAKFSLVAKNDPTDATPTSPTMSSLNPYIYEQQNTYATIGGEVLGNGQSTASLLQWSITISNNLNKANFTYGNGNLVRSFPEQLRKVSGTMQLYFESNAQLLNFNAAIAGGALPPISALIPMVSIDLIPSGTNPFAIGIWMPKLFLKTLDIGDDTSKAVTQTYSFDAGESTPGANDTIEFYVIANSSSKY